MTKRKACWLFGATMCMYGALNFMTIAFPSKEDLLAHWAVFPAGVLVSWWALCMVKACEGPGQDKPEEQPQ